MRRLLAALCLVGAGPSCAAVLPVANATEFAAALKKATPGDTISLAAAADLGWVSTSASFAGPVTIVSADPKRPAHISGLKINGAHNLVFAGLDIGRDRNAEPEFAKFIEIRNSSDITFRGGSIHGSRDSNPSNDMMGVYAGDVARLTLTGVLIEEVFRGLVIERCTDALVEKNDLRMIRSDGIDIAGDAGVRILGNRIGPFRPIDGDHPDAIQFWTTGQARGSSDVEIRGNLILSGPEGRAQGIFLRDELGLFQQGRGYARIAISGNTLVGTGWHGIATLDTVDGLTIDGNTLLRIDGPDPIKDNWIMASNGRVANNSAPTLKLTDGVSKARNRITKSARAARMSAVMSAWDRANRQ